MATPSNWVRHSMERLGLSHPPSRNRNIGETSAALRESMHDRATCSVCQHIHAAAEKMGLKL